MAYFNQIANVKVAVPKRQKFNLSHDHITTQDFNTLTPISIKEMVAGDTFHVEVGSFTRLAPLPCPTYGNVEMVTRAFFVPMRLIMQGWNHFYDQTTFATASGIIHPTVPYVQNNILAETFATEPDLSKAASGSQVEDFIWEDGGSHPRILTRKGRQLYNILIRLGYKINFHHSDTTKLSLLPLFAYARVCYDWYYPSQYLEQSPMRYYFEQYNWRANTVQVMMDLLDNLMIYEYLEKDQFTQAWINPNGPNHIYDIGIKDENFGTTFGGGHNLGVLAISEYDGQHVPMGAFLTSDGTGINNTVFTSISQYALNVLEATQDYINRNMLAGNRPSEQSLARFGLRGPDANILRSEYLGHSSSPIQISDVMATAGTQDNQLGDYAGKGLGTNHGSFHYEANEFGYLIVMNCIIAHTGYVQGRDPQVLRLDPLSFYTPEFDCVGTQPIRNDRVFADYKDGTVYGEGQDYGGKPDGIFGFEPRYADYKNPVDYLSGDFMIPSRSTGMDSYHLFRIFPEPDQGNPLSIGLGFMSGDPSAYGNNFGRIFNTPSYDHFICVHHITINASRPMHSLGDSIDTDGSREISIPYGGDTL